MVYKGLRVDEETLAAVDALREEGETESACLRRVLAAGVAALNDPGGGIDALAAQVAALQIEIERLSDAVEELARPRWPWQRGKKRQKRW